MIPPGWGAVNVRRDFSSSPEGRAGAPLRALPPGCQGKRLLTFILFAALGIGPVTTKWFMRAPPRSPGFPAPGPPSSSSSICHNHKWGTSTRACTRLLCEVAMSLTNGPSARPRSFALSFFFHAYSERHPLYPRTTRRAPRTSPEQVRSRLWTGSPGTIELSPQSAMIASSPAPSTRLEQAANKRGTGSGQATQPQTEAAPPCRSSGLPVACHVGNPEAHSALSNPRRRVSSGTDRGVIAGSHPHGRFHPGKHTVLGFNPGSRTPFCLPLGLAALDSPLPLCYTLTAFFGWSGGCAAAGRSPGPASADRLRPRTVLSAVGEG
jgi:hypothetical protein